MCGHPVTASGQVSLPVICTIFASCQERGEVRSEGYHTSLPSSVWKEHLLTSPCFAWYPTVLNEAQFKSLSFLKKKSFLISIVKITSFSGFHNGFSGALGFFVLGCYCRKEKTRGQGTWEPHPGHRGGGAVLLHSAEDAQLREEANICHESTLNLRCSTSTRAFTYL